jgi:hypothetical protein
VLSSLPAAPHLGARPKSAQPSRWSAVQPMTGSPQNRPPGHGPNRCRPSRNPFGRPVCEVQVKIDGGKLLRTLSNDADAPAQRLPTPTSAAGRSSCFSAMSSRPSKFAIPTGQAIDFSGPCSWFPDSRAEPAPRNDEVPAVFSSLLVLRIIQISQLTPPPLFRRKEAVIQFHISHLCVLCSSFPRKREPRDFSRLPLGPRLRGDDELSVRRIS